MAARSRITVLLLLFLLTTEHSFAVDQNKLASMVDELLRAYHFNGMFSLAVSIPLNQNQNKNQYKNQYKNQGANQIIQEVLDSDPADDVKNKIDKGGVYVGNRMVAADAPNAIHAESHVVDKLDQLVNNRQFNKEDLLLFYVYASPCVEKCTSYDHPQNILLGLTHIQNWNNYAVVFSKIFKPRNGPGNTVQQRIEALDRLANYQTKTTKQKRGPIGLENIFRCDRKDKKQPIQCVSCSSNGQVAHECVSDDPPSATRQIKASASINIRPQPGRGDRVRRDISLNTGDSSSHISENKKGAEDSVDGNGNEVGTGEAASSSTGESVSLSSTGSDDGNGSDLRTAEDVSSPQIGFDSGDGNGKMSRGKGKVSKGKGGKGRRRKGGKGKGRRGKGGKGKGRRGKGGKGGKGKGSRRGGRSRRRGLDQEWIFVTDF